MRFFLLALFCSMATVFGATPSTIGGVRVSTDTTGTNTIAANMQATNLNGGGIRTALMLRDVQVTNAVVLKSAAANYVAGFGANRELTNTTVTTATLAALAAGATNNWVNEGTTNSTLAGIAKPWRIDVTNSVNVGQTGEAGLITISNTNGVHTISLFVASDGTLTVAYGTTNMLTLLVGANANNNGSETNFLTSAGFYTNTPSYTSPPGTVATNIDINPTTGTMPVRISATAFGNSTISTNGTNIIIAGNTYVNKQTRVGVGYDAANAVAGLSSALPGYFGISDVTTDGIGKVSVQLAAINSADANFTGPSVTATASSFGNTNATFVIRGNNGTNNYDWAFASDANRTNTIGTTSFSFQAPGVTGNPVEFLPMGPSGSTVYRLASGNAISTGYILVIGNTPSTNLWTFGPTGVIEFGPGTTNVLYRGTNNLVYTNNAASTSGFIVKNSLGEADLQVTTGGNAFLNNPGSGTVGLSASSGNSVEITGTRFFPDPTTTLTLGSTGNLWLDLFLSRHIVWNGSTNTVFDLAGSGSPEGSITASPGSTYRNYAGGTTNTFWVKESGAGNTGWINK